jgi:hypothetical protein
MSAVDQAVRIRFLFIGEGPFDDHLVTHLRRCCILAGADEAEDVTIPTSRLGERIGRTVATKLKFALAIEPNIDVIFIHRDADSTDPEPRYSEISKAVGSMDITLRYVAIVPVQETEAWLLLDESEIRRVAENPTSTITLDIPSPRQVESISSPKECLAAVILKASEQTGRRYRRIKQRIHSKCTLMLDALDPEGPVCEVPSWQRMFSDLKDVVEDIAVTSSK